MKMTTGILGCALAAGLVSFASSNVQAGTVIGNTVYAALNIKSTATYEVDNKYKKATLTNKDILEDAGLNGSGNKLAVNINNYDVYVIDKDSVIDNLTSDEVLYIDHDEYIYTEKEGNNSYSWTGQGEVDVDYYPYDLNFDHLNLDGVYSAKGSWKYNSNDNMVNVKESLTGNGLSGYTATWNGDWYDYLPATGSVKYNGSGKIED